MNRAQPRIIGIDTGGTFTDFIVADGTGLRVHKVLSTPQAPERAILQGLAELGLEQGELILRHGSTVATNAVLEGKGASVVYVGNTGFADLLSIGRQNRARLYTLSPEPEPPPVPPDHCLEVPGRMAADGTVVVESDPSAVQSVVEQVESLAPQAVAINLLFSYVDDRFERELAAALAGSGMFVSLSSQVLPEIGEYERGMATWLNAYVGPIIGRYIDRLQRALPSARVEVMQSSGLTVDAGHAARHAVHLLLSGPAGGLAGALAVGRCSGLDRLMTLDVGGTSTDVALLDGDIELTRSGRLGRYPVAVPMVDLHTIGAGGGSIARVDAQGLLHVGPQSAGADPGPACYGQGGREPTLTDANLVLGRIPEGAGLGDSLVPDLGLARSAMQRIAEPLGLDVEAAAAGVVRLANEHMTGALRVISVARGHDPRQFTLCCFGGAGGLHACELAELLDMPRVLVPLNAGVLSALGMLASPPGREVTRAVLTPLEAGVQETLDAGHRELAAPVVEELRARGLAAGDLLIQRFVDLRYQGQSTALTVPWRSVADSSAAFAELHEARFGHALDHPVEVVCLRARVAAAVPERRWDASPQPAPPPLSGARWRDELETEQPVHGPLSILEATGTTWVAPGWRAWRDTVGNLLLEREPAREG